MTQPVCPQCGAKGPKLKPITAQSLLREPALSRLGNSNDLRFCKSSDCDVAYFGDSSEPFLKEDVRVSVFQKSSEPERLVCYCFLHTVAEIETEVRDTGNSAIPDSIMQKCKSGLDRCEETNPQGGCCLGNVRQVVKAVKGVDNLEPAQGDNDSCCS